MAARTALHVVFTRAGLPLECRTHPVADPGPGEVLVRVSLAGVCGTDAHRLCGDLAPPPAPVNFGHEAVGVVEAIGADAGRDRAGAPLAVGDAVYWAPVGPCGECVPCHERRGCERAVWPAPASAPNAAAFQQLATVPRSAPLYRIPDGTPPEAVIALGCGMPTAVGGMAKVGPVTGQVVVVQGAGPVGLAATLLAALGGARKVVTIGDPAERLAAAGRLGATDTIALAGATAEHRRARVMELSGGYGADLVVEAAGHPSAFPEGLDLLGRGGRLLILGLYSGSAVAPVDAVRVTTMNLSIIGSLSSDTANYRRTVEIAADHGARLDFPGLITHRFGLASTEEAIRTVASGATVKAVIQPGA